MFFQCYNPGDLESDSPALIILALVQIFLLVLITTTIGDENHHTYPCAHPGPYRKSQLPDLTINEEET